MVPRIRAAIVAILLVAAIGRLPGLVPAAQAAEPEVTVATYDVEPFREDGEFDRLKHKWFGTGG